MKTASVPCGTEAVDCCESVVDKSSGTNVASRIIAAVKGVIADTLSRRSCMDKLTATNIHTNVTNLRTAGVLREKHQIAQLQFRLGNLLASSILVIRSTNQVDAEMLIHILHIAGTIKPVGGSAAINVLTTQKLCCVINDLLTRTIGRRRSYIIVRGERSTSRGAGIGNDRNVIRRDITGFTLVLDLKPTVVDASW